MRGTLLVTKGIVFLIQVLASENPSCDRLEDDHGGSRFFESMYIGWAGTATDPFAPLRGPRPIPSPRHPILHSGTLFSHPCPIRWQSYRYHFRITSYNVLVTGAVQKPTPQNQFPFSRGKFLGKSVSPIDLQDETPPSMSRARTLYTCSGLCYGQRHYSPSMCPVRRCLSVGRDIGQYCVTSAYGNTEIYIYG